ncbi:DNA-damage-inducible protein D [compost metagenome]
MAITRCHALMSENMDSVQNKSAANDQFPVLRGAVIRRDSEGRICLNDVWRAAGQPANNEPSDWRSLPSTKGILNALRQSPEKFGGMPDTRWIKGKGGKGGGTFADPRLALGYAEYLSPELALEVKEVFLRYTAADATLADDVLERASPEANEWAAIRALGRSQRRRYTDCLQEHGAGGRDYAICTDSAYRGFFGKTAKDLKAEKGLGKSASLRDAMSADELTYVTAAEALARERINEEGSDGGEECRIATLRSAQHIRRAIELDRNDRKGRNVAANENRKPDSAA